MRLLKLHEITISSLTLLFVCTSLGQTNTGILPILES